MKFLLVQVREGNLRFSEVLIYEHGKGCAQLCSGCLKKCRQLDAVQHSAHWHVFLCNDNVANSFY